MSSSIYAKTGSDKVLILESRKALIYPFAAAGWLDLRLGLALSITSASGSDTITGLSETLAGSAGVDRAYLGFKTDDDILPAAAGSSFAGMRLGGGAFPTEVCKIAGSTTGPNVLPEQTTGANYWRGYTTDTPRTILANGATVTNASNDLHGIYLPQDVSVSGGYALLMILRMTRASGSTSVTINRDSNETLFAAYSSTPTVDALRALMASSAYTQATAVNLGTVPTTVYCYWPFNNSRLRIHNIVLEKFA